jgi:hypothetical protein
MFLLQNILQHYTLLNTPLYTCCQLCVGTCGGENASDDATKPDKEPPQGHVLLGDFHHQRADVILHKDPRYSVAAHRVVDHPLLHKQGETMTIHPHLQFIHTHSIDLVHSNTHTFWTYPFGDRVLVCVCWDLVGVQFGGHYGDEVLKHLIIWQGLKENSPYMNIYYLMKD